MSVARLAGAPALIAFAALATLGGCTQRDVERAGNTFASAAPRLASDALLVTQVEAKLFSIDADSALHVAVAGHDGEVHLSGKVRNAALSRRFVAAAGGVPGVKHVTARLALDAGLPRVRAGVSDFAVVAAVRAHIAAQAGLNGLNVGVAAHAGTVTLAGRVGTRELRATIVDAARKTPGVKAVVDKLDVRA